MLHASGRFGGALPRQPTLARAHTLFQQHQQPWRERCCSTSSSSSGGGGSTGEGSGRGSTSPVVFPHQGTVAVDDGKQMLATSTVIELLQDAVSAERLQKMQEVIAARSYSVVPVVEGLFDMGNLAAVCRSADAFGFGAVHCIMQPSDKYKRSQRSAAGADKWLDTRLWESTSQCLSSLKAAGFQVVVTSLTEHAVTIQDIDWTCPTAFVLGNEQRGVSDTALQLADKTAIIPMAGFVESYNISVAAALIMYEASQQRLRKLGRQGDLTEEQQQQLLASFLLRGVKHGNMLVTELLRRPPPPHQRRVFKHEAGQQGDAGAGATAQPGAAAAAPAMWQHATASSSSESLQQREQQPAASDTAPAA